MIHSQILTYVSNHEEYNHIIVYYELLKVIVSDAASFHSPGPPTHGQNQSKERGQSFHLDTIASKHVEGFRRHFQLLF